MSLKINYLAEYFRNDKTIKVLNLTLTPECITNFYNGTKTGLKWIE